MLALARRGGRQRARWWRLRREREGEREEEEREREREREEERERKKREREKSRAPTFSLFAPPSKKSSRRTKQELLFPSLTRADCFLPPPLPPTASPSLLCTRGSILVMPSRALALPSAAALLATVKTTMASVAPSLYAAVGAAVAFLLGLRLVFGTLASCLPFGCKVRKREKETEKEMSEREGERKREKGHHGCFDKNDQSMAVGGEEREMASSFFFLQR